MELRVGLKFKFTKIVLLLLNESYENVMKKTIIADSGSTKTDWRLQDDGDNVEKIITPGINPYFMDAAEITTMLKNNWNEQVPAQTIDKVFFYGAGCSSKTKCEIVSKGMSDFFKNAEIKVYHDLLAAARSLFEDEEGIAGILGTGSNSCLYVNGQIWEELFSLGYMFGDHGSGAQIGKNIVDAFLKDQLPDYVRNRFIETYQYSKEELLDHIYNRPNPNRFLAGFSEFASKNMDSAFIHQIVKNCFSDYFKYQISKYSNKNYRIRFVGSVAYYFRDVLETVAAEYGMKVDLVIKNPVENLLAYHKKHNA
mgnify:FL=1